MASATPLARSLRSWLKQTLLGVEFDSETISNAFIRRAQEARSIQEVNEAFLDALDASIRPTYAAVFRKVDRPPLWQLEGARGNLPEPRTTGGVHPLDFAGATVFRTTLRDETVGLLYLGPRQNKRPYGRRDRRFINHLAYLLALRMVLIDSVLREAATAHKLAAVQEAKLLQEQFLNMVSHELRTPVSIILAAISLLNHEGFSVGNPLLETYFGRIYRNAEQLSLFLDDLVNAGQLNSGQFTLNLQTFSCCRLLKEAIEDMMPLAREKQQSLEGEFAEGPFEMEGDPQRIGQVFRNLLINAITHNPEGTAIHVTIQHPPGRLRVGVQDNGKGIALVDQPNLFTRFSRLNPAAIERGAGLGLFIAKAIVEAHGGVIGVESVPGRGSTFWFDIPSGSITAAR